MEVAYYSAQRITFDAVCYHCGGAESLELANDDELRSLKEQYARVRPLCIVCRAAGKQPATWGPQNRLGKRKRT